MVTSAAIVIVRTATFRYTWSFQSVWKFTVVQLWTSWPVNESTVQNAETNSATSAAM